MANDDFNQAMDRMIQRDRETEPSHYGKDAHGPYQIWRINYTSPNGDVKSGFTCDREFANLLIDQFKWYSHPHLYTSSFDDEEIFKKWKSTSRLILPERFRDLEGKKNEMNTWWVNFKNKKSTYLDKDGRETNCTFLDKNGEDPYSTVQLGRKSSLLV